MIEADAVDWREIAQEALSTMPRPFLLAVSMMATPLMGVTFFPLHDGFVHFFPGEPIGGVPETRLAGVGRANQRWGKKEPASSLMGMVCAAFCEQCCQRSDGRHHHANENDHFYAHVCSPGFDCVVSSL